MSVPSKRYRVHTTNGTHYVCDYGKVIRPENHPEGPYREHTDSAREVGRSDDYAEAQALAAKLNRKGGCA